MTRQYLDHASTSPLRPEARDAMQRWLDGQGFGDPSRVHAEGLVIRFINFFGSQRKQFQRAVEEGRIPREDNPLKNAPHTAEACEQFERSSTVAASFRGPCGRTTPMPRNHGVW